jgi:hypothetical protein
MPLETICRLLFTPFVDPTRLLIPISLSVCQTLVISKITYGLPVIPLTSLALLTDHTKSRSTTGQDDVSRSHDRPTPRPLSKDVINTI